MPFVLPTFNLAVNLWHNGNVPPAAPDVITIGNLTPGRRTIGKFASEVGGAEAPANMFLLVPAGTDIRDAKGGTGDDLAEVPAGSGRFYTVRFVDDIGFGFANEHRFGILSGLGPWPIPFPHGNAPLVIVGGPTCVSATAIVSGQFYAIDLLPFSVQWFRPAALPSGPPCPAHVIDQGKTLGATLDVFQGTCVAISPALTFFFDGTHNVISGAGFVDQFLLAFSGPGSGPGIRVVFLYDQP